MRNKAVYAIILTLALSSCATLQRHQTESQPDILSGSWEMRQWMHSDDLESDFPRGVPVLEINSNRNEVSGFNGCNRLNGRFRFDRDASSLQFFALQTTKMFCLSVAENDFSRIMTLVDRYRVTDKELYLLQGDELLMVFQRKTINGGPQ
ncbi:META domain-containing protein [Alkalitalea saponilacus]|uniref:Heat shock protein HslJ n=1 Tax=Alkalitalea saponilacus TaxID=889453 RepID=A0A1T5DCK6_9BACT|nr:META domain-containing protein [Alkalitalea saponilacus]ASB50662.1 hypothetical protein CDL62_16650 [Alkalitalea saponilacus]SKB69415.1 Heat shock protein HslJ [Alkalitalea saponilacus]